MTLFEKLKLVKTEEDVRAVYIKALGLTQVSRNLIDIQTKEIWIEAKNDYKTFHKNFRNPLTFASGVLIFVRDRHRHPLLIENRSGHS